MRQILLVVLLAASYTATAQTLVLDKGSDTLMVKKTDTIFKIGFKLKGTHIGSVPTVKVVTTLQGTAGNGVDYTLYDQDSVKTDSVMMRAKNNDGSFLLYLRTGLTQIKSAVFAVTIADEGKPKTSLDTILFTPFKEPEKMKAPEKKDSLVLKLIKEIDIPIYDSTKTAKIHWYKSPIKGPYFINIDSVGVERSPDGKYRITVFTADGETYSNEGGTDLTNWDGNQKLKKNGTGEPYLLLKDFLQLNEDKKENQSQTLTPQHKTIKVPKN